MFFVVNTGSSSVKSVFYTAADATPELRVDVAGVGRADGALTTRCGQEIPETTHLNVPDARAAVRAILGLAPVMKLLPFVTLVGHRVVHGGEHFTTPTTITGAVRERLAELAELAPLHNRAALQVIDLLRASLPDAPHVAVFDTAFHATLPVHARSYALPRAWVERFGLRRFGFHGTSHRYVAGLAARHLQRDEREQRIVSCHLGSGASVAAIEHGKSIDTSMGMTPLEGLVMGTRAGDVDPGVLLHLLDGGRMTPAELDDALNRRSGLLGMTGTDDVRELEARALAGDEHARDALQLFAYRVLKYVGAYAAALGGIDALVLTGGIGERSASIRAAIAQRLEFLGLILDAERNRAAAVSHDAPVADVAAADSPGRILVVATDEERAIAQELSRLGRATPAGRP